MSDANGMEPGFSTTEAKAPCSRAFMAPVAARVRCEANLPVATGLGMNGPADGEQAIASGQMDLVMIARAHLADPHYAYQLAQTLGIEKPSRTTLPAPWRTGWAALSRSGI